MGDGYWILVWDRFGSGLNMVNPRLHTEGERNWWSCEADTPEVEIVDKHKLDERYPDCYKIIRV